MSTLCWYMPHHEMSLKNSKLKNKDLTCCYNHSHTPWEIQRVSIYFPPPIHWPIIPWGVDRTHNIADWEGGREGGPKAQAVLTLENNKLDGFHYTQALEHTV
jgi:hypothetical protein